MKPKFTPGPWRVEKASDGIYKIVFTSTGCWLAEVYEDDYGPGQAQADAALIAAAPEMCAAVRAFVAWLDSEDHGPNYGSQSRDTHPRGEEIWREWWERNLAMCDEAQRLGRAALAKAEGRS